MLSTRYKQWNSHKTTLTKCITFKLWNSQRHLLYEHGNVRRKSKEHAALRITDDNNNNWYMAPHISSNWNNISIFHDFSFFFINNMHCILYISPLKRLLLLYAAHAVRWLPRLHKSERHLLRIHYNIICTYQAVLTHIHVRFDASTDIFFVYKFDSSCLHTKCICMQLQWCPLSGYHIHALSFAVTIHFAQKVLWLFSKVTNTAIDEWI